jgi:hypothetical protein
VPAQAENSADFLGRADNASGFRLLRPQGLAPELVAKTLNLTMSFVYNAKYRLTKLIKEEVQRLEDNGPNKAAEGQPHSKTLSAASDLPKIRQVLECGCPSAALVTDAPYSLGFQGSNLVASLPNEKRSWVPLHQFFSFFSENGFMAANPSS